LTDLSAYLALDVRPSRKVPRNPHTAASVWIPTGAGWLGHISRFPHILKIEMGEVNYKYKERFVPFHIQVRYLIFFIIQPNLARWGGPLGIIERRTPKS